MTEKTYRDLGRFGVMVLLGPITFLNAIGSDFKGHGDQLVAGVVGSFLWFMVIMEAVQYV